MLLELRVSQLALVDDLVLPAAPGLTMLTGETGAGKSMIAGALSVLAGAQVPKDLVREGEDLAWVEGVFDLAERPRTCEFLARAGVRVAADGILVLRRELRRQGRNRVLINGLTSSLALLEAIGPRLLQIQSQNQQQDLADPDYARDLLDGLLECRDLQAAVGEAWTAWRDAEAALAARRAETEASREQLDLWRYQRDELAEAQLDPDEEAVLSERLALLRHSAALREGAAEALQSLAAGEGGARDALGHAQSVLSPLADLSPRLGEIAELLETSVTAAGEAQRSLDRFLDGLDLDPAGLDECEARQALYAELKRKYRRDTTALIDYRDELARRVERQDGADDDLAELTAERDRLCDRLAEAARLLHERRSGGAAGVARDAERLIRPMSLAALELAFAVDPLYDERGEIDVDGRPCRVERNGADRVSLRVRTNPGEGMGDVAVLASGGERSRIHLGLTALRRDRLEPPLLLLDEIDSGLGMDAAAPVARLLADLAAGSQVLCITHLPTMAVHGRHHWRVVKRGRDGRTVLDLERVEGEERVAEIARLLGGRDAADDAAEARLSYARDLLATRTAPLTDAARGNGG